MCAFYLCFQSSQRLFQYNMVDTVGNAQNEINKFMISTAVTTPDRDFWQQLTTKVAQIGERTHHRQQNPHIPGEISLRKKGLSRFEIEETINRTKEEERLLNNRIKFFETQKQRNMRTLQMARRKYERVMQVRAQSIREKQQCKQIIEQINKQLTKDVSSRAQKVRQQKKRIIQSVQKVREINKNGADSIRILSMENEDTLKSEKEAEIEHKKQLVQKAHASMESSRIFLQQMQEQRIKRGRLTHRDYLQQKLQKNNSQQRKNSILKQKLQESLMSASREKQSCLNQIKAFQTITPKYKNRSIQMDS